MDAVNNFMSAVNAVLWHDSVLVLLLGTGVLFTFWSGFCQYRALTHGSQILRGKYDDPDDPGAINHFQALSAALSATVGLGNIGGVALAVALGGPGAVFWMWVVGFFGMSIKLTEVTLSMLYRNTEDPDNPHGGPMWVASKALANLDPKWTTLGKVVGGIFCVTLLVSTITGGNMFQAWNVGVITEEYFQIPSWATGIVLAILVAMVIIGGIKRIGAVAGRLVPTMVTLYILSALYVLFVHFDRIPEMLKLIVVSAFNPAEASGAFIGGTVGTAFLFGMKRALFSNEAGQGSSPIAHSAAKTDEPVREGMVAGLEPFIDTLVVCTMTALVILSTGVWNRGAEVSYEVPPSVVPVDLNLWSVEDSALPPRSEGQWTQGEQVYMVLSAHRNKGSGNNFHQLHGVVDRFPTGGFYVDWESFESVEKPRIRDGGIFYSYEGATLTAKAFDTVAPGLGKWLVTLAAWLFAISTMISWSYYGEQGIVYLFGGEWLRKNCGERFGEHAVTVYKVIYCLLIVVATLGFITTNRELDNLTGIGTGVMLFANIPILWFFGYQAMRAYKEYVGRLTSGRMEAGHKAPSLEDLISGRDVEK